MFVCARASGGGDKIFCGCRHVTCWSLSAKRAHSERRSGGVANANAAAALEKRLEWQLRILKEVLSAKGGAERAELLKEHADEEMCTLVLALLDKVGSARRASCAGKRAQWLTWRGRVYLSVCEGQDGDVRSARCRSSTATATNCATTPTTLTRYLPPPPCYCAFFI